MKIVFVKTKNRYFSKVFSKKIIIEKIFNSFLLKAKEMNIATRNYEEIYISVVDKHMIRRANIKYRFQNYFPEVLSIFDENCAGILFSYLNFIDIFGFCYKEYDFYYCFLHSIANILLIDNSLVDTLESVMSSIILN